MPRHERPQSTALIGTKPTRAEAGSPMPSRRSFFRNVAAGAGASALAAVAGAPVAEAGSAIAGDPAGYRETDHVKKAYATARF